MLRIVGVAGVLLLLAAAVVAAARSRDDPSLTPEGPATLRSPRVGAVNEMGVQSDVLIGARITVSSGGRAGRVRLRVVGGTPETAGRKVAVGEWFVLPAAAGAYQFPTPHVRWDARYGDIALDQTTGGHAIMVREPCDEDGCPDWRLAIGEQIQPDSDGDLRGDRSEDRTDLRVTTRVTGGRTLAVTISNAGPLSADQPLITVESLSARGAGWQPCAGSRKRQRAISDAVDRGEGRRTCPVRSLPAGASTRVTFPLPRSRRVRAEVVVTSEGEDLHPADNTARVRADSVSR